MGDVRICFANSTGAFPSKAKAKQTCWLEQSERRAVRSAHAVAMSKRKARRPYMTAVATEAIAKGAKQSLIAQAEYRFPTLKNKKNQ